ncbi:MAG: hypothetical protein ACFFDW_05460 [Candidatus Thorarchaeota archaeon]
MINPNDLKTPFIKVLQSGSNEREAQKIQENLKAQGYKELITFQDFQTGRYDVGVFDYSRLNIFDQLNNMGNMKKETCDSCGRPISENDFFKCINCGYWECVDCGMTRLYGGKIPLIHNCGHDDFEFLANVGQCKRCKQPLGFRAVPQKIRMYMMANTLVGRAGMVRGIIGCYAVEEIFIEKEIIKIYNMNRMLPTTLLESINDTTKWFPTFIAIKANYLRMAWSSDYVKEVLSMYLKMFGLQSNPKVTMQLNSILPHFVLFKEMALILDRRMRGEIPSQQLIDYINKIYPTLKANNMISPRMEQALLKLSELSPILDKRENFSEYAQHISTFFQLDMLDSLMQNYQGTLKC